MINSESTYKKDYRRKELKIILLIKIVQKSIWDGRKIFLIINFIFPP